MSWPPKVGAIVNCPPDRGDRGYKGVIKAVSPNVYTNINGVPYVWVTVGTMSGKSVHKWPSHRLGFRVPTEVPSCRLHIDHELDPRYHE